MDFNEYQKAAYTTATYPNKGNNLYYPALGLGEAGEVQNKVKKVMRDYDGVLTEDMRQAIISEVGDTLWYLAAMASELKVALADIARENIAKLKDRQQRGMIKGSGDNR